MHGLLHVRVPLLARRLVTAHPRARASSGSAWIPTLALVLSQVVLSFGIPFALIPLVALTAQSRRARRVPQPTRDDDRRDRGIRLPHRAERRAALAGADRSLMGTDGAPVAWTRGLPGGRRLPQDDLPPHRVAGRSHHAVPARRGARTRALERHRDGAEARGAGARHPSPVRPDRADSGGRAAARRRSSDVTG